MEKFYTINDTWKSEDRRKLLAYARDLLNSDYGSHRLTFQLFAQSAPFAQSAAVYRNFDWNATLEFVKKSADLSDNVYKPDKINNGDPSIKKWYDNNFKHAAE
jgi:4-hydroxyphenylacetate 3-monooxygenase